MTRSPVSRFHRRLAVFAVLAVGVLPMLGGLPATGQSASGPGGFRMWGEEPLLDDADRRVGEIAPSAEQLAAAEALGATSVTWNAFGTPKTLINHGGYLSSPREGAAADVAREWVRANRGLFRLSDAQVDGLEMLNDSPLYDSPDLARVRDGQEPANPDVAHVVLFRQTFGDLPAGNDGLLNVGVQSDGRVAWASSSVTGDETLSGSQEIDAAEAIGYAAADVGLDFGALTPEAPEAGRLTFSSELIGDPQRARLVALPTPTQGVRPAWEVILLDSSLTAQRNEPVAFQSYVDAETGDVLLRIHKVEHLADGLSMPAVGQVGGVSTTPFSGSTGEDGACDELMEYEVGDGVGQITVFAQSVANPGPGDVPDGDILLNLYFESTDNRVAFVDGLEESPEVLTYGPGGGVAPGTYLLEVCPFRQDNDPIAYSGTFSTTPVRTTADTPLPRWDVFPANPPFPDSENPSEDTRVLWCWVSNSPECDEEQINTASRVPWDFRPDIGTNGGTPTLTTDGNNASAAISEGSFLTPDTVVDRPAPDPERVYDAAWTNNWLESKCDPRSFVNPSFDPLMPVGTPVEDGDNDDDASTYNLFVMHNRMHDWSYYLGFTEQNFNLQQFNFNSTGGTGREKDPILGSAQAGRLSVYGRDNANLVPLPEGIPNLTNQYLWEPLAGLFYAPCTDGAYDMAVVAHEYAHATTNRMIAGPDTGTGDSQGQTESWSDLNFAAYFTEFGISAGEGANPLALGPYVTGNKERGIRNFSMSDSPLNYSDIGYDGNGLTSPHANGEIWSAVNWDIALALNEKYDAEFPSDDAARQERCARGEFAAQACPGNRRWAQLMFDGYLLQPAGASMLESRDSMLAADMLRFDGANQAELWNAFAGRGMGETAFSDTVQDQDPRPGWSSPLRDDEARVRFEAADAGDGAAQNMEVFVGAFEARVTPTADTNPDTAPITDTVEFVPGTYEFIARADGFGAFRFTATLEAGDDLVVSVPLRRNLASIHNGAEATGDGVNLDRFIDDTEETNWASFESDGTASEGKGEGQQVEGRQVTVELADGAQDVSEVQISAALRGELTETEDGDTPPDPGSQSRFSALRSFDILACNAEAGDNCDDAGGYEVIFSSADDAFPGVRPRPTVSDLSLRPFDVADTTATHIQLRVRDSQCTGGPLYQGEANPVNDPIVSVPDCDAEQGGLGRNYPNPFNPTEPYLDPPIEQVRAAELQVFSTPAPEFEVGGTNQPPGNGGDGGGSGGGGGGVPAPQPEPPVQPTPAPGAETTVERAAGAGRVETAIMVSQAGFEEADTAVLARADDFPDALAASTLAAETDAPLLLTDTDQLLPIVADELARLGVEQVYLMGGTAALSQAVEDAVSEAGYQPQRVGGVDRFETAGLIAREVVELGGPVTQAVVARADLFPDALAAGNVATNGRAPILLTSTESLHATTDAFLDELLPEPSTVFVAGGTAAVSDAAASAIAADGHDVQRRSGAERYATAAALATEGGVQGAGTEVLMLASGANFPDALTAAPAIHALGGTLLLVDPLDLGNSAATATFIEDNATDVSRILIAGGTAAVSDQVESQVSSLVGID